MTAGIAFSRLVRPAARGVIVAPPLPLSPGAMSATRLINKKAVAKEVIDSKDR